MNLPEQIGRYKVESVLGRGGMAVVYLARDPLMKRHVAIKALTQRHSIEPQSRIRFQKEAEVIASLEHPYIVPVYDFGEYEDHLYIIMRYMSGGSLADRLVNGPLDLPEVNRILRRMASALDESHSHGIVHRDLKPGNILFDQRKDSFLSDFGIVKLADGHTTLTGGILIGTPTYMSPEQAKGEYNVTGQSDIYSLGVIMYEILSGKVPYHANTPIGVAMKHINDPVPDLLDVAPDLPPSCQDILDRAMAKTLEERYATAGEMVRDLYLVSSKSSDSISFTLDTDFLYKIQSDPDLQASKPLIIPTHNLPPQPSPFIGRKDELDEISSLLDHPSCRLLTLVGPGGIGKTRLALQAALNVTKAGGKFQNGIFFVPFASLSSGKFLIPTIAEAIKFSFYSPEDPKAQLLNYLREKSMLLIFDNFEHLLDKSNFLVEILQKAPFITIIVTSRERLNLRGEWIIEVQGLGCPEEGQVEDLESCPSIQLFIQNANRVLPGFSLKKLDGPEVIKICQLVEGIPLGIELASAWVRLLSCEDIAKEIENNRDFLETSNKDVPERHRSLRAVFEYSWNQLPEKEQTILQKLSVFRGGFDRNAAQRTTGASLPALLGLTDKSLIRRIASGRYEMLEVVRQYSEERLCENPKERKETLDLHCQFYAAFMESKEQLLRREQFQEAFSEIRGEIENVRAAWKRTLDEGRIELIGKFVEGLYHFYEISGWMQEGVDNFSVAISALTKIRKHTEDNKKVLGMLRARQGGLFYRMGYYEKAQSHLRISLDIAEQLKNRNEIAFCLSYQGATEYRVGNFQSAKKSLQESLGIFITLGNRKGIAICLHHLALVARDLGEHVVAKDLHQKSLRVSQEIGDRFGIAISLNNLGEVASHLGKYAEATQLHQESLTIRQSLGDRWGIARSYSGLGWVAYVSGDMAEAKHHFEASQKIYAEIGDRKGISTSLNDLGDVALGLGSFLEARRYFQEALDIALEIQALPIVLEVLVGFARLYIITEEEVKAVELLALILNHPSSHDEAKSNSGQLISELENKLTIEEFIRAQTRGVKMKLETVITNISEEESTDIR